MLHTESGARRDLNPQPLTAEVASECFDHYTTWRPSPARRKAPTVGPAHRCHWLTSRRWDNTLVQPSLIFQQVFTCVHDQFSSMKLEKTLIFYCWAETRLSCSLPSFLWWTGRKQTKRMMPSDRSVCAHTEGIVNIAASVNPLQPLPCALGTDDDDVTSIMHPHDCDLQGLLDRNSLVLPGMSLNKGCTQHVNTSHYNSWIIVSFESARFFWNPQFYLLWKWWAFTIKVLWSERKRVVWRGNHVTFL